MAARRMATGSSIRDVRRDIVECERCPLSGRAGVHPVPWRGDVPSDIVIVGEAPGREENLAGVPFVGPPGRLLEKVLGQHGIDLDDCCAINTVCCFPDGPPPPDSQRACRVHLRRQMRLASPRWVLLLGAVALRYFDDSLSVSTSHGKWWRSGDRIIFPTFHPAAALRNPEWRTRFETDLERFARLVSAAD